MLAQIWLARGMRFEEIAANGFDLIYTNTGLSYR